MLVGVAKMFIGPSISRIPFRERSYILPSHASTQPQLTPKRAVWANLKRVFSPQSLASNSVVCSAVLSACDVWQCGIFGHSTAWCHFPTGSERGSCAPRKRMNEWGDFYLGAENLLHISKLFIILLEGIQDLEAERIWMPVSLLMFLFVLFIYNIW